EGARQRRAVCPQAFTGETVTSNAAVDDVIRLPAECVEREHASPLVTRQQVRGEPERSGVALGDVSAAISVAHAVPMRSATIFPELMTPGTPAPGCVPAPAKYTLLTWLLRLCGRNQADCRNPG